MRIGVVAHPRKNIARLTKMEIIKETAFLVSQGADIELVVEEGLSRGRDFTGIRYQCVRDMDVDLVICIGGDGTILRTMQLTSVPVLGLNAGSLGFLMEPYPSNIRALLEDLLNDRFIVEERTKLSTVLNDERLPDAVNEAVVMTGTPSKIQDLVISINGEQGLAMRADGVIVSTPTGSTSYALSAGGSIIDPRLPALEIVPIAPFRVNIRPLTVPDNFKIDLKVIHRSRSAIISIDGNYKRRINYRDRLSFTRSGSPARFIRFEGGFYKRLNEKILNYVHSPKETLI
ncbi:MAG: NAD(+)/NADH kinase [Candidatus Thermoplasmatota archaeon]|jgi:NAD+ kinase|nr:NAD(+)/NADH kinase [Candidatus Thermoplasmatota archaeon]